MPRMNRREFIGATAGALFAANAQSQPMKLPIIDAHMHLFDTTRPQGVPWPEKDSPIYQPALLPRFHQVIEGFHVVGAIEIECSPWLADNQWVLDQVAHDPLVVGTVGDLEPAAPEFQKQLEGYCRNPLFRGIRYGNIWDRDIAGQLGNPDFVAGLKTLAGAGLELDMANPDPELMAAAVRVTDLVPNLRIVLDHLPRLEAPADAAGKHELEQNLRELGQRPRVYAKMSGILRRVNGSVPEGLSFYRPTLDHLWDIFGEDRLMFGSDWPNGLLWGTYAAELSLAREYLDSKSPEARQKFFWKNSLAAYRWVKRDPSQPPL